MAKENQDQVKPETAAEEEQKSEPQAETDEIRMPREAFNRRLERARTAAVNELLAELTGGADLSVEQIAEAIAEWKQRPDAVESEVAANDADPQTGVEESYASPQRRVASEYDKINEIKQQYETLLIRYQDMAVRQRLTVALTAAGCLPGAIEDAVVSLLNSPEIHFIVDGGNVAVRDEYGKPVRNGETELTPEAATALFLQERPHFMPASGTIGSGTGGVQRSIDLNEDQAGQLASSSIRRKRLAAQLRR